MMCSCLVFVLAVVGGCLGSAEDVRQHDSALPSPVRYFHLPEVNSTTVDKEGAADKSERDPRFGVQLGYGNDFQGYSGGAIGYTPLKIDLGGLVLGTVIGLGAVLLAPKLFHIFSPPHHPGPYARSENEGDMLSTIGNTIARIDERLQENNIDTMSCLQKAACSLVRSVDSAKNFMNNSRNPIFNFLIDGSKLKSAIDRGMKGDNCAEAYPHCAISSSNLLKENKL